MTDIYDEAIQATLKYGDIKRSWLAGGNGDDIPLHGLLFRCCPNLGCCLTEYKSGMGDRYLSHDILDDLKNDDLMPSTMNELELQWLDFNTEERIALLERFAMYNRELDDMLERDPAPLAAG